MKSLDIYRRVRPFRQLLGLESMKQKAIEQFLGVSREDKYSGGQLIEVYRDYLHTHDKRLYDLLILHNEDDLKGMPAILPILSYPDLFESDFTLSSLEMCTAPQDEMPLSHICSFGGTAHFPFPSLWTARWILSVWNCWEMKLPAASVSARGS